MSQAFTIETLDRSGRWYLTPGAKSIYDLRIRNDSKNSLDCSLVVEDPTAGVTVNPSSFTLRGHEVRTVTVTFAADTPVTRAQRTLMTLRDDSGNVHATFEHPLILTGGTDCSISISWKDALVENGEVRGFQLGCSLRSQSEGPSSFPLSFTEHPSLRFPNIDPISLQPGQVVDIAIPVRWDRTVKDSNGLNHPPLVEVGIPVSNGKRTSRLRWEAIDAQMQPFYWNNVLAVVQNGTTGAGLMEEQKPAVAATPSNGNGTVAVQSSEAVSPAGPAAAKETVSNETASKETAQAAKPLMLNGSAPQKELVSAQAPAPAQAAASVSQAGTGSAAVTETAATAPLAASTTNGTSENTAPVAPPAAPVDLPLFSGVAPDVTSFAAPEEQSRPPIGTLSTQNVAPPVSFTPPAPHAYRTAAALDHRKQPLRSGFVIGGLSLLALAIAALLFKSTLSTQPSAVSPGPVATPIQALPQATLAAQPVQHVVVTRKPVVKVKAPAAKPKALAAAPVATPTLATLASTTKPAAQVAAPAHTQQPVAAPTAHAQAVTPRISIRPAPPPAYRRRFPALRYVPAQPGLVVALGGIEAHYGARGRAVRIFWSEAAQSSATVSLIDDRGTTVNSVTVSGSRQTVLLYLPPRYHGAVTVALTLVGRLGERVAQTTSLPPFGQ